MFDPGPEAGPLREVCRGRGEVQEFFRRLSKVVVRFEAEPRRFIERGDDVLVLVQMYARFSRRVEAWIPVIHQWTLRERTIIGWRSMPSTGRPLEAVLLPELRSSTRRVPAGTSG